MTRQSTHADGVPLPDASPAEAESRKAGAEPEPTGPVEPTADGTPDGAGEAGGAEEAAAPPPLEALAAQLERRLEEAQRLLERQTEHAARLHEENQRLLQGELRSAQLPLVRDLLRLHDDLGRLIADGGTAADDLGIVRESLLDALARNGVVPLVPAVGEAFEARAHRAVGPVATDAPEQDRTIAELHRGGFVWEDGAVIRPAEVHVFKHAPPQGA